VIFLIHNREFCVVEYADAKLILGLGSKLAIAGCFNVIYVYTCEIFPTSLRTVAVGVTSLAARIGSIIAPFLAMVSSKQFFKSLIVNL